MSVAKSADFYLKKMEKATTDEELIDAKAKWYARTDEGKAKTTSLSKEEEILQTLEAEIKKAKDAVKSLKYDISVSSHPTAEDFKKIQDEKIQELVVSGNVEGMLALVAEQKAKAKKVVKSKGGRRSAATSVDKNWNPEAPSRMPTGRQINCTVDKVKGKKPSEELWSMGGHYKCPYNCNADRTSLSGAQKHFDKCSRRPNHDIGEKRSKEPCAETNYEMSEAEITAYWGMLKHTNGKCGEEADEIFKTIAPEPLASTADEE